MSARAKRQPAGRREGVTIRELATKTGVSVRTIRFYTTERILPPPEFQGSATRYSHSHLLKLAAIRSLQRNRRMSLPVIREYLRQVGSAEVERLAIAFLPELAPTSPALAVPKAAPSGPTASGVTAAPSQTEAWHRLTIVPGVELHWHSAASAAFTLLAHEAAQRIRADMTRAHVAERGRQPDTAPPSASPI